MKVNVQLSLKPILQYALGLRFNNLKRFKMREKPQPACFFTQRMV